MHFKIRKKIILIISSVLSIIFSIIFYVANLNTLDYSLDHFYYSLNNYNSQTRLDGYEPPILEVSFQDEYEKMQQMSCLKNAYLEFHYNIMVDSCRMEIQDNTFVNLADESIDIQLMTQPTFWITNTEKYESGYILENGQYITYFDQSIIEGGNYYNPRFGADCFIYISDCFADFLVQKFNINSITPYKDLILNEEYSKLTIYTDTGESLVASINNILYSKYKKGPTAVKLFGERFALIQFNNKANDKFNLALGISLKTNPYTFKTVVQQLPLLLDGNYKYNYSIKKYTNGNFSLDYEKTDELQNIIDHKYNRNLENIIIYISLFCSFILIILDLRLVFIIFEFNKIKRFLYGTIILLCIIGIVSNFVYVYPSFSLIPLILLVSCVIAVWKYKHNIRVEASRLNTGKYYEITI